MAPHYERPALPVPQAYPALSRPAASGTAADPPLGSWQSYFLDDRLRSLIGLALENNRDLRASVARVEQARAQYGVQRAESYPSLSLGGSGTRSRTAADQSVPGTPAVSSQYEAKLMSSTWEIDFWGRIRSLNDAALETYLSSDATRQAAAVSLVAQVANAYLVLCEQDERLALARQSIVNRQESVRIFTRRVQVGSVSRLDLTDVQALLLQAQTLASQLEQSRAQQVQSLALLIGAPVDLASRPAALNDAGSLRATDAGLPSDLLVDRPDILAAEHDLKSANASIGAARAAFFPTISLSAASFGTASGELNGLFKGGSKAWTFAGNFSAPIFDAGRNRNNLAYADAKQREMVAQYESVIQGAFRDVANALESRRWLTEQLEVQQATVGVQTERARLSKLRYDNGAENYLSVLDAQRDLLTASQDLVQARRAMLASGIDLYSALGGGANAFDSGGNAPALQNNGKRAP